MDTQSQTPIDASAGAGRRHRLAVALFWVTPALWSSNYIIARAASGVVPPHVLACGRWLIALALFLPLTARPLAKSFAQWRGEWPHMLVLGALGMWICGAFVYIGAHTTSATNIGLIYAATPVGIAVISTRLAKASLPPGQRRAMVLSLVGVVFVIARGDPDVLLSVRLSSGDLWIVAAAVSWIAYSVLQPVWRSVLTPMQRLTCITAGGLVILLPLALIEAWLQHYTLSVRALALIVLAGLLPGFFSYTAYSYMIRELGAARAGLVTYLAPVYAALTAWWILGEPPRWFHLAGAALILPSIYIATRAPRRAGT